MALFIVVDGTDRAAAVRLVGSSSRGEGFRTSSAAMSGTVESGLIEIEDSAGALDIKGWRSAYIIESTASPQRIWTGFIANVDQTAGPFKTGAGRVHQCETVDLNWNLTRKAIETGGKRPAETDLARATWILGHSTLSGLVYSGALTDLTNNPVNVDEADYTDQYPIDVLADICPVSGKTAYVTWDYTNNRPQLFYDLTTTSTYDSPAAISDVLADVLANPTTVFAPRVAPVLHRVIEDAYSDVWLRYVGGIVHVHSAAFETAHARRDLVLTSSRIGRLATANTYVALYGDNHAQEVDSLECEVELAAAHVNDIMEGHRIYFKSSHLSGFTSYAYTRVERRTVRQVDDQATRFVLGLQLSDRVLSALPGGPPPSSFPHQPGVLAIIQQSAGLSTRTFSDAPTDADILVLVGSKRGGAPVWASYTDSGEGGVTDTADYVKGAYKTASSTSATMSATSGNEADGWYEISAGATLTDHKSNTGSGYTASTASISIPAGGIAFMVAGIGNGGGFDAGGYSGFWTPPAGWVTDLNSNVADGHPGSLIAHRASAAGETVTPTADFLNNGAGPWPWQMIVMVFGPAADSGGPPAPGQLEPWTVVTMSGAVGTTAFPYAARSLEVKVDGVLISTASYTETNNAAGTFTLGWTPDTDEVVTVQYLGI